METSFAKKNRNTIIGVRVCNVLTKQDIDLSLYKIFIRFSLHLFIKYPDFKPIMLYVWVDVHGLSQGHIYRYAWFISGPYL